jgi:hypothetical protein
MDASEQLSRGVEAARLARGAVDWLIEGAAVDPEDPSLYHGLAGVVLALQEAQQHFGDDRYSQAVTRGADALGEMVDRLEDCSLYFGLAGVAVALNAVGRSAAADRSLSRIRERFDGQRWNEMFELLAGNAGIGLGALHVGDVDLAVSAVTPYLTTADPTPCGVNWAVRPSPPRSHHIAHGTLGIVYALAAVGDATGRDDMIDTALAGTADVVSRNDAGPDSFLVPHSDPPHRPELIERYSRLVQWACRRRTGLSAARPDHRRPSLDRPRRPLLAHGQAVRAPKSDPTWILGQQRPLLRYGRRPGTRVRPHRRAR